MVDPPSHRPGALAADLHDLRGGYGPLGGCGQAPQRRAKLRRCGRCGGRCRPQQDPIYEADFGCINSAMRLHHEALAEIYIIVPIVPMPSYVIPDSCLDPNVTVCTSVRNSAQLRKISKQNQICAMFYSLLSESHGFLRILRIDLSKVLIRLMPRSQYLRAV